MQLFSGDANYGVFKKKLNKFWPQKSEKNGPQKLLIIGQDPFIPQSSPGHSPQSKIDFPFHEISRPDTCSLICGWDQVWVAVLCILQLKDHRVDITEIASARFPTWIFNFGQCGQLRTVYLVQKKHFFKILIYFLIH